jgi:hypothetical protein
MCVHIEKFIPSFIQRYLRNTVHTSDLGLSIGNTNVNKDAIPTHRELIVCC